MPKLVYFLYFLLFGFLQLIANADDLNVKKSLWNGFERQDFQFNGVKSILVVPHSPAKNSPWVWRARFFGHQPQADIELLKKVHFLLKEQGMTINGVRKILDNKEPLKLDELSKHSINATNLRNKIINISNIVKNLKNIK